MFSWRIALKKLDRIFKKIYIYFCAGKPNGLSAFAVPLFYQRGRYFPTQQIDPKSITTYTNNTSIILKEIVCNLCFSDTHSLWKEEDLTFTPFLSSSSRTPSFIFVLFFTPVYVQLLSALLLAECLMTPPLVWPRWMRRRWGAWSTRAAFTRAF